MILTTDRLVIRYMEEGDLIPYDILANTKFVRKTLCMWYSTKEESQTYLRQMIEKKQDLAIVLRNSGTFIGKIHLDRDSLRFGVDSLELAYWVGQPFARQGYMTEALTAVIRWLFQEKGYQIITVRVLAPNMASRGLLTKLGFTQEGYLRRAMNFEGTVYDDVNFSLLKEEFHS